jgi:hypothetical protein
MYAGRMPQELLHLKSSCPGHNIVEAAPGVRFPETTQMIHCRIPELLATLAECILLARVDALSAARIRHQRSTETTVVDKAKSSI